MASQASPLIVPVENQHRELDGKLLLACIAAERGFPVVFGSRAFVHHRVASLPRGVYLAKSMRTLSERMFDILRKLGHEIVAWDEEALVRVPDAQYYQRRLSPVALRQVAALFAWGPDDARLFREYPHYPGTPIHVTGNPRVDMMRSEVRPFYAEEVERLRRRHGRFVLLNTNFGWNNHYLPGHLELDAERHPWDEFMTGLIAHRGAIFERFLEMVPRLGAAFPELTILLRPHPTESHRPWQEAARGLRNVVVLNEGNVIPWLMACEVLVHNGCTTAIEAAILDVPSIAYQPVRSERFDDRFPNSMSHRSTDFDDLADKVRAVVKGGLGVADSPERRRRIQEHIAALDGPLAAERMVEVLAGAGWAVRSPGPASPLRFLRGWTRSQYRTLKKHVNMRRSGHRNGIDYHDHRFPGVSAEELRERVARLGGQLGRFGAIRVRQTSAHVFQIEAERTGAPAAAP